MSAHVRFSIIIPCFNSATVIDAALESVRRQDLPAEVIIVDGGSADATLEHVRRHGDLVAVCISEPDRGIYDAINKGLPHCTGDLIGVLGSDDRYAPEAFARIWQASMERPADIYAGATRMVSSDGSTTLRPDEPYGPNALISGIPFGHNAMFATPAAYARVGPYELKYRICSDSNWVHRAVRLGLHCHTISDVVVEFALNGTSSTNDEEIMAETFETIATNFPGLGHDEARSLLFAVRKWGPSEPVARILEARPDDVLLRDAVGAALPELLNGRGTSHYKGLLRRLLASMRR